MSGLDKITVVNNTGTANVTESSGQSAVVTSTFKFVIINTRLSSNFHAKGLRGLLAGATRFTATLGVRLGLAGSLAGHTALSAALKVFRGLAGNLVGRTTFTGSLRVLRGLVGSITGRTNYTANLTIVRGLNGSLIGKTNYTAGLSVVFSPDRSEYFRRGAVFPGFNGTSNHNSFDYFRRGQPIPTIRG